MSKVKNVLLSEARVRARVAVAEVEPRVDTLWVGNFSKLAVGDFGTPTFHGRFHPEIVLQALLRYMPDYEEAMRSLVWDPMAGGGTTGDVCAACKIPCVMSDLDPIREDIFEWDAADKLRKNSLCPVYPESVDILVLHPPYWSMIGYGTPMDRAKDADEFREEFRKVAGATSEAVKYGGHAVLVVPASYYTNGEDNPVDLWCLDSMLAVGYTIRGRVAKEFGETKQGHKRSTALWKYRALNHGFWEYGWEEVIFLRKD